MIVHVVGASRYAMDPRVDIAAKALAWMELTEQGRATCDWLTDFSEAERLSYRAQAITVMEAIDA